MIDKERLEEIKKELELDWSDISYVVNQDDVKWLINRVEELEKIRMEAVIKDIEWLIQQAERVQELEQVIGDLDENVAALETLWLEEKRKNQRYKQALEFYAHKKNYDIKHLSEDEHEIPVFKDYGEKARQALEGDDD